MADLRIPTKKGTDKFSLEDFQHDLSVLNEEIENKTGNGVFNDFYDEVSERVENLTDKLESKVEAIDLNNVVDRILTDCDAKIEVVQTQVNHNISDLENLRGELEFKVGTTEIDSIITEVENDYNEKLDVLQTQISEESAKIGILNDKIEMKVEDSDLLVIKTEMQYDINSKYSSLEQKIDTNTSSIDMLSGQISLKVEETHLEDVKRELQNDYNDQFSTVTSKIDENKSSIDMLSDKIELKVEANDIETAKTDIRTEYNERVSTVENQVNIHNSSLALLGNKIEMKVESSKLDEVIQEIETDYNDKITQVAKTASDNSSSINVLNDQIALKVEAKDITEAKQAIETEFDGKITNVQTQIDENKSSIDLLTDQIELKVESKDIDEAIQEVEDDYNNKITNVQSQVTTNTGSINVLNNQISLKVEQSQVVTTINNAVNNIQIGGRNLTLGTKDPISINVVDKEETINYCPKLYFLPLEDFNIGDYFTVSFDIEYRNLVYHDEKQSHIAYQYCGKQTGWTGAGGNGATGGVAIHKELITNDSNTNKYRFEKTFGPITEMYKQNTHLDSMFRIDCLTADSFIVKNFKFEKGTKATSWTPAPEDIDSAIEVVDTKVNTNSSSIDMLNNQISLKVEASDITTAKTEVLQSAKSYVDNLEVGGTNLLKNSGRFTTTDNWAGYTGVKELKVVSDETYSNLLQITTSEGDAGANPRLWNSVDIPVKGGGSRNIAFSMIYKQVDSDVEPIFSIKYRGADKAEIQNPNGVVDIGPYTITQLDNGYKRIAGTRLLQFTSQDIRYLIFLINYPVAGKKLLIKEVKLEWGTKPTEWTPAPEDVEASITEVKTQATTNKSSIDVLQGQIALKVEQSHINSAKTELQNDYNQKISNVQTQSTNNKSSIDLLNNQIALKVEQSQVNTTVNNAVDNIQIGGRNLFAYTKGKDGYIQQNTNAIGNMHSTRKEIYSTHIPVSPGEKYIFQIWATPTNGDTMWYVYQFYGSDKTTLIGDRVKSYSSTALADGRHYSKMDIVVPSEASYIRVSYRRFNDGISKLEKGTKPTDWTPAPEDVDSAIEVVNTKATTNTSSIDMLNNQIALKVEQSHINSAKTELQNDYNQKITNVQTQATNNKSSIDLLNNQIALKVEQSQVNTTVNNAVNNIQIGGRNLWIQSDAIKGYTSTTDGTIYTAGAANHQSMQRLTEIPQGTTQFVYQIWNPNNLTGTNTNRVVYFKADKTWLSHITLHHLTNTGLYRSDVYTIPSEAKYIRFAAIQGLDGGTRDESVKIKFEWGNKATDWSPAPEDIDTAIQTVDTKATTNASSIEMLNNQISLKVEQSQVNTTVNNAVNDIQIGGRNLYKDTKDFAVASYWDNYWLWAAESEKYKGFVVKSKSSVWGGLAQKIELKQGQKVTISFYGKVELGGTIISVHRSSLNNYSDASGIKIISSNCVAGNSWVVETLNRTAWTKFYATYEATSDITFQARIENSIEGKKLYVCGFKLEYGTKPTDWSPAPEDVDSAIETVQTQANTNKSSIDLLNNQISLKVEQSQVNTIVNNATASTLESAKSYADTKKTEAINAAATDATNKVNAAKTELNNALASKANSADVYTKTETYKKSEIDATTSGITSRVSTLESTTSTLNGTVSNHATRLATAEAKITDSAIINTVSNTITNAKNEAIASANSSLTQTANQIKADFKATGGTNLLRNSNAKNGTQYWVNNGGGISIGASGCVPFTDEAPEFVTYMPSGIRYYNAIQLKPNTDYIYEAWIYCDSNLQGSTLSPLHMWCNNEPQKSGADMATIIDYRQNLVSNTFSKCYVHFKTKNVINDIWCTPFIYTGTGTAKMAVREISLREGVTESPWTPHADEVYSGSTIIDAGGVTINNGAITVKDGSGDTMLRGGSNGILYLENKLQVSDVAEISPSGVCLSDGALRIYDNWGAPMGKRAIIDSDEIGMFFDSTVNGHPPFETHIKHDPEVGGLNVYGGGGKAAFYINGSRAMYEFGSFTTGALGINGNSYLDGNFEIKSGELRTLRPHEQCLGHYVSNRSGSTGTGYAKFMRIQVTGDYANMPIKFTVVRRGAESYHADFVLAFKNAASATAHTLSYFARLPGGSNIICYLVHVGNAVFDLYTWTTAYDFVTVTDLQLSPYMRDRVSITYPTDSIVGSLPSECVQNSIGEINTEASKNTSGYCKITNGMYIQWGQVTINTGSQATINFPIAFPNAVFTVLTQGNYANSNIYTYTIAGMSKTGVTIYKRAPQGGTSSDACYWVALGY